MGAEIPRYNLEKLQDVNAGVLSDQAHLAIPFVLDDLPEAVHHAIVSLLTSGLSGLELSATT